MNWSNLSGILQKLYSANNVSNNFNSDELYLRRAFHGIEYFWLTQYISMKVIRYVMISEAPLWGNSDSYFYNPNYKTTPFFTNKDLNYILSLNTTTKQQMLIELNKIGFLVLDISPFAFNSNTHFIYNKNWTLLTKNYSSFVDDVFDNYLKDKLDLVVAKKSKTKPIQFFYRYNKFPKLKLNIETRLSKKGLITKSQIGSLRSVHQGHYLDKHSLSNIVP